MDGYGGNASPWIDWLAALSESAPLHSYATAFPPDRFYCLLDELPLHLVPQPSLLSQRLKVILQEPLFLNPECSIGPGQNLPHEFASRPELFAGFVSKGTVAWVRNTVKGTVLPFWLGPTLEAAVRSLSPDHPAQSMLPEDEVKLLAAAGILVSKADSVRSIETWRHHLRTAAQLFREKNYVPLSNLIHPFHVAALRRYYRYLIRTGKMTMGDSQSDKRYVAYNEPVARFFHHELAATMSAVAGQPVKPSYPYFASYLAGAELKKHTDRAQCEFSITFCLDASPEPVLENPWPIHLETPQGTVTVYQALGDGLFYRGTQVPHYRNVLAQGKSSTSIFFHYVPEDFAGSLD